MNRPYNRKDAMPWTKADRENVLEAMREIIDGKRVVSVTTADRSETRQMTTLKELEDLLTSIDGLVTARPRLLRSRYNKGL